MSATLDDPAVRARVVAAVEDGATQAAAAESVGVTRMTLSRAKKRWPAFEQQLAEAALAARARAEALRSARRRRGSSPPPAAMSVGELAREVVVAELVEVEPSPGTESAARAGQVADVGKSEFFRLLAADARDPDAPGHKVAMQILARYFLEPDLLVQRLRIEREGERAGEGKPRALVVRVPDNSTHGGSSP